MDSRLIVPAVSEFWAFWGTMVFSKFWKRAAKLRSSSSFSLRERSRSSGDFSETILVRRRAVAVPNGRSASRSSRNRAVTLVRIRA